MKKILILIFVICSCLAFGQSIDNNIGQEADPLRNYSSDDPLTSSHHDATTQEKEVQAPEHRWPEVSGIGTTEEDYDFLRKSKTSKNRNGGIDVQAKKVNDLTHEVRRGLNKHRGEIDDLQEDVKTLKGYHQDGEVGDETSEEPDRVETTSEPAEKPQAKKSWFPSWLGTLLTWAAWIGGLAALSWVLIKWVIPYINDARASNNPDDGSPEPAEVVEPELVEEDQPAVAAPAADQQQSNVQEEQASQQEE